MKLNCNGNCFLEYNLSKSAGVRVTSTFYGYSGFYGCQIVVGKPSSRKEMLYYLRSYVQNVRGATGNLEPVELEDKKPLG